MKRFLKDRMSSIFPDLYEEILKSNKIRTNRIIQIVPCNTVFTPLPNVIFAKGNFPDTLLTARNISISLDYKESYVGTPFEYQD